MTGPALALEAATPADVPALAALERLCQSHPWSEQGLRDALAPAAGEGAVLVLRAPWAEGDASRGIRAYCAFQVAAGEAHVHNLAVAPGARRRGFARRLLLLTLGIAARRGAAVVHLEVRAGNAAARALYRSLGFREVGRRREYYKAPVEDALLLTRAEGPGGDAANLERPPAKC